MRIALFGGTFDPPHRGHLAVARAAAEAFRLETVLLVPTARQPLKTQGATTDYEDRFAMVELLCGGDARLAASRMEAPDGEQRPNYTVDTVRRVRAENGVEAEVYVILGADSFLDIRRWHESEALLGMAEWVVVSRPGFSLSGLGGLGLGGLGLSGAEMARVHLLETVHEDVSATEVRRRLGAGEDCGALLTAEVMGYIAEHGLYRKS